MNITEGREIIDGIRIISMIISLIAGAFMLINSLIVLYMPMVYRYAYAYGYAYGYVDEDVDEH
jgi:hypothetical protein